LVRRKTTGAGPIRYVPDNQPVQLDVRVTDTVGVGLVGIEYRISDHPTVHFEPVVDGKGGLDAAAKHVFSLAGKVKPGGTILYRLRAMDNRKVLKETYKNADGRAVPVANLDPHVGYVPRKT